MTEVAKRYQDQLTRIKRNIESDRRYFRKNHERYHKFQKFVFETAISEDDESTLKSMGKPVIEFNITNAPISRLCGEFFKAEPSIYVTAEHGTQVDPQVIEVVEGHLRHIIFESNKSNTQYCTYRAQLSGGFSNFKVYTDYAHEMSFDQVIKFCRTFEDTMTGYDPLAREVTKFDSDYSYEIYPFKLEDFKRDYPSIDVTEMTFTKDEDAFNWTYEAGGDKIVVIADYYEKKKRKKKIVKLADNRVLTMDDYQKFLDEWATKGFSEVPPAIVGEPRWSDMTTICRYKLVGNAVIDYEETSYKYLPHIFVDGDSVRIKADLSGSFSQFTKPYIYHAEGIQRLTNFSGQVIANDFENMVMHKFKVAKESIPVEEEYQEAYKNVQIANTLVYNAYYDDNPDQQLPPPMEIARVPLPPEVVNTFNSSMSMMMHILGSYEAQLGIMDGNNLSGKAIETGAIQTGAAALPYTVNYMQALTQVAINIVDLIPKYYVTPRTIPVVSKEGKRSYQKINQPGGISFNYDENALSVRVEAGPNFAVEKNQALMQIINLMKVSPLFNQFMNEEGLAFLLDNMTFKGAELLKDRAEQWMEQLKKMREQQQQQPSPEQIQAQMQQQQMQLEGEKIKLQQQVIANKHEQIEAEISLKTEQLIVDKEKADNDRLKIELDAGQSKDEMMVGLAKVHAEEMRAAADLHLRTRDMAHSHATDIVTHHLEKDKHQHQVEQSKKEKDNG